MMSGRIKNTELFISMANRFICISMLASIAVTGSADEIYKAKSHSLNNSEANKTRECTADTKNNDLLLEYGGRMAKFNESCFVDLDEIQLNHYQLVDVRNENEYRFAYIKDSINIPIELLSSKNKFKNKKLLLINNGMSQYEMGQYCQILKDKGFMHVKILKGGIHNWLSEGRSLTGNNPGRNYYELYKLNDFFMDYKNGLIKIISTFPDKKWLARYIKEKDILTINILNSGFNKKIQKMAENNEKPIVVILSKENYLRIKTSLGIPMGKDIYYLLSNDMEIVNYMKNRHAINQARVNGPGQHNCNG